MDIELVCPIDKGTLRYCRGVYECLDRHRWDVVNSIPRFVGARHYSEAFGLQWNTWPKVQLDSYTGFPISADRAKFCLGTDLWERIVTGERMNVLEAGCGAGRFTEVFLNHPSVSLHSVDASVAVEANQKNCPQNEKHRIYQADITRLPFRAHQFDLVFCLGVVQHTPSPEETIRHLYNQVREGGALVFDHYYFRAAGITNPARFLLRLFLKRMKPEKAIRVSNAIVDVLFPLHRASKNSKFLQFVLSRLSPLQTAYFHPQLNDRIQYQWAQLDTHDGMTDWYKHSRSKDQIRDILARIGSEHIDVFPAIKGGGGVVGRCYRPRRLRSLGNGGAGKDAP